ncbi:type II secretion system F family protein [Janibacter sp. G1551]|jgi:Flp pilus assembly protein TadB|uniref:type II secretion system F family protein n=1 Tax=Janibacter sp. G1551 TaxID=3420440 RepID=UPI003CFF0775
MTGLQLAIACGALMGLGVALLVWRFAPSDPDLADALERLSPDHVVPRRATATTDNEVGTESASTVDQLGVWAIKTFPAGAWSHTPRKDLAILQISETRFYGEKVVWALLGLAMPPLLAGFFGLIGLPLPFAIPTIGSLALAALFWFMPNYNVVDDAKKARIEFNRALGAYIDMVATGVRDGHSGHVALSTAAEVGDKWVFRRIETELRRARYMTRAPWDSLHGLADELGVPELDDLADIMQQSGKDGAQIYENLRARATAMRSAMLSAELGKANSASERMYIPASLLGIVFMAILVAPSMLRFAT